MEDLSLIVEKLNAPPFSRGLSLASFDELGPTALLQLANDVLGELDRVHRVDARDEPAEACASRLLAFLQVLKYPGVGDARAAPAVGVALSRGDRAALYPVLAFVLARLPALKKRAYVARYLLPVEVPPEVAHDEGVGSLLAQFRALQGEFKEAHKALERAAGGGTRATPAELKREIAQLEDERGQLIEKIGSLRRKTDAVKGFAPLLEATSALRKEQEEEARLAERMQEQRLQLAAAEKRYGEVNHRLAETRARVREDVPSGEAMLDALRRENEEVKRLCAAALPASLDARRETLGRLQRLLAEPPKSEAALAELRGRVASSEAAVARLTAQVAGAQRAAGDDKLAMFRQQAALVARKLAQREEALDALKREAEGVAREVEAREAKLSELSGPKFMRREEFKAYAASLRTKTGTFKGLKAALGEVRQETVVLARTEELLKGRAGDMDAFLARLEAKKGVSGYTQVASDLEKVSALKARIDDSKGATLQEFARIVDDIQATIRGRKERLKPQMDALRAARAAFHEANATFVREKATYESVAVGLEAEKAALERQADALQAEAAADEARAAHSAAQREVLLALAARAREENGYEAGEGRFNHDFATHKELYAHKLQQVRQEPRGRRARCAPTPLARPPLRPRRVHLRTFSHTHTLIHTPGRPPAAVGQPSKGAAEKAKGAHRKRVGARVPARSLPGPEAAAAGEAGGAAGGVGRRRQRRRRRRRGGRGQAGRGGAGVRVAGRKRARGGPKVVIMF
jgi:intraflagellar transport protein 81